MKFTSIKCDHSAPGNSSLLFAFTYLEEATMGVGHLATIFLILFGKLTVNGVTNNNNVRINRRNL